MFQEITLKRGTHLLIDFRLLALQKILDTDMPAALATFQQISTIFIHSKRFAGSVAFTTLHVGDFTGNHMKLMLSDNFNFVQVGMFCTPKYIFASK